MLYKILFIVIFIILIILNIIGYYILQNENLWKLNYLKKVYPLATNLKPQQYDNLEMFWTYLLPEQEQNRLKKKAYKANLPGPSCSELPCDCDGQVPDVSFAPDPILQNGWPPCSVPETKNGYNGQIKGSDCCKSVDAMKKCMKDNIVSLYPPDTKLKNTPLAYWTGNGTWIGNKANIEQPPPNINQVWKPSLWPKYTLAVNKYDPKKWNNFYNSTGDSDNAWIEVVHSSFFGSVTPGVWFYRTIGSGIFVNLTKTISGLNKLDVLFKLLKKDGVEDAVAYTTDYFYGNVNSNYINTKWQKPDPPIININTDTNTITYTTPETSKLNGSLIYWLNGQNSKMLYETINEQITLSSDNKQNYQNFMKKCKELLNKSAYGNDYDINRICNTGALDNLITYLCQKLGYESCQFTVQPNIYTGWTTEIMILGKGPQIYTSYKQLPKNIYRVLNPNNIPTGPTTTDGTSCNFSTDIRNSCAYCENVPATMNKASNCSQDVSKFPTNNCLSIQSVDKENDLLLSGTTKIPLIL